MQMFRSYKIVVVWQYAKKVTKTNPVFQYELNTLLDLCRVSCQTLSSVKATKKKEDKRSWSMDYELFKG